MPTSAIALAAHSCRALHTASASPSHLCWRAVQLLLHARGNALLFQRRFVFLAQEGILQPIRNCSAAFGHVDRALVGVLLPRHSRFVLAMIVGPVPTDEAQRLLADPEMGVEPIAAIRCRGNETNRLVILPIDLVGLAVLPGCHPDRPRPRIGVALAFDADEDR